MVFDFAKIYYFSITVFIGIWFSVLDIKTRKIKNYFITLYFLLSAILFPFLNFNNVVSSLFGLLCFYVLIFVFYMLGIFGGADFKYLSISVLGMFVLDGISSRILLNFLFFLACSLIAVRIAFYLIYNRRISKQIFDYLEIPVGSLNFLKRMLYYPMVLSDQFHLESVNSLQLNKENIAFSSDPMNLDLDAVDNFADIDCSDQNYDRKIHSGKIQYIGKLKFPTKQLKIQYKHILFYQPAIPLIPLLFFIQLFISLFTVIASGEIFGFYF